MFVNSQPIGEGWRSVLPLPGPNLRSQKAETGCGAPITVATTRRVTRVVIGAPQSACEHLPQQGLALDRRNHNVTFAALFEVDLQPLHKGTQGDDCERHPWLA